MYRLFASTPVTRKPVEPSQPLTEATVAAVGSYWA